jgi:hypothetical protein
MSQRKGSQGSTHKADAECVRVDSAGGLRGDSGGGLRVFFDGEELRGSPGQTIAAVLMSAGKRIWRHTSRRREPRGLFCGMGVCFDCLVRVDGRPNVRACRALAADAMRVDTQHADGLWEESP